MPRNCWKKLATAANTLYWASLQNSPQTIENKQTTPLATFLGKKSLQPQPFASVYLQLKSYLDKEKFKILWTLNRIKTHSICILTVNMHGLQLLGSSPRKAPYRFWLTEKKMLILLILHFYFKPYQTRLFKPANTPTHIDSDRPKVEPTEFGKQCPQILKTRIEGVNSVTYQFRLRNWFWRGIFLVINFVLLLNL